MAPRGTPNVAVISGTVTMKADSVSGNGVYLQGDNGDRYYYFHLDSYEGGARRVSQGEVVGYTGNTGDASGGATHTHFEIHPGGGGPVNPYPTARAIC
jgi:murein DD-endopeptidase MepM/ murein hydrolase activator NlpD